MRLWTGQLVLCLARTRTSATILLLLFLSTSPLPLVISTNQYLSKIFRRNRTKERKKRRSVSTAPHHWTLHAQSMQVNQFKKYLLPRLSVLIQSTHTHNTHMYIHTKILVLQYFLMSNLQTTRAERPFALQNETAERKGGSYMFSSTVHLLDVLSLCSALIKTHTLSREKEKV